MFDSHLMQSEALVDNNRRPRETWVGSLSQTGFTSNFTVVSTGGWVTGFSPELVVDSGYTRNTPFVQWMPREYSGLSLLTVKKKEHNVLKYWSVFYLFKLYEKKLLTYLSSRSQSVKILESLIGLNCMKRYY
ncbi:hypothetical protein Hanom_Chr15g01377571 [Helianthus anomalus]